MLDGEVVTADADGPDDVAFDGATDGATDGALDGAALLG